MSILSPHLSIITFNVNRLNSPNKKTVWLNDFKERERL